MNFGLSFSRDDSGHRNFYNSVMGRPRQFRLWIQLVVLIAPVYSQFSRFQVPVQYPQIPNFLDYTQGRAPSGTLDTQNLLRLQACYSQRNVIEELNPLNRVPRANVTILKAGYSMETRLVATQDGYILSIFRITGGLLSPPSWGKPVALLWHGLANGGEMWTISRGSRSFAEVLADNGFEVWLVNGRGTDFSQGHVTLDANRDYVRYWNFSFHEMGVYDLPAVMDFILEETQQQKIFYIGFSQGCSIFSVTNSLYPEYNNRFHAAFLLAPGIYIDPNPIIFPTPLFINRLAQEILNRLFQGRIDFRNPRLLRELSGQRSNTSLATTCRILNPFNDGWSISNNENALELISKWFDVVNLKSFYHFAQTDRQRRFQQYDYGIIDNLRRYGSVTPPAYNLSRIAVPIHIWYGATDGFISRQSAERFGNALAPGILQSINQVNSPAYGHSDFIIASRNDVLLHNPIVRLMRGILTNTS